MTVATQQAQRSVAIKDIADRGTLDYTLLTEADSKEGDNDARTSVQELDRYLDRHADARLYFPKKNVEVLRATIAAKAADPLPSAEEVLAKRTVTAEHAAALIKAGQRVLVPVGHMYPTTIMEALKKRASQSGELDPQNPVKLFGGAQFTDSGVYASGKIVPESMYLDTEARKAIGAGRGAFLPLYLHRIPPRIRDGRLSIDVALVRVSEPDADGYVSLGTTAVFTAPAIDARRKSDKKLVIAEMTANVPRTKGATRIHISDLDKIVRTDAPIKALPVPTVSAIDARIADHLVKLIPDGATLQFGIGGVPNAVASKLAEQGRTGLKVRSEMISDGVMLLDKAGALEPGSPIYFSFMMGSEKCLKWMDNNPRLVAMPVDECNDPGELVKIDKMVSVNTALRLDLLGQINAQQVQGMMYSGVGGQVDFFRGAMGSKDGRAILAIPSTRTIKNAAGAEEVISNIVFRLDANDVVTTSMHDAGYIVTEWGVAAIDGLTLVERARALIAIADPKFRPQLTEQLEAWLRSHRGRG